MNKASMSVNGNINFSKFINFCLTFYLQTGFRVFGVNPKNSNPDFTRERHIFHYTFLFDAYFTSILQCCDIGFDFCPV